MALWQQPAILAVCKYIVLLSGAWLVGVAFLCAFRPRSALSFLTLMASTTFVNMTELALRFLAGAAMFVYARQTAFPGFLAVFGALLSVTAGLLTLVPRRWHAAYAVFWSQKLTIGAVRVIAMVALALGIFLISAVTST